MRPLALIATTWTGARVMKPWRGLVPPSPAERDEIAARLVYADGGAKPTVRVVAVLPSMAPLVIPDGPLPEDEQDWSISARS